MFMNLSVSAFLMKLRPWHLIALAFVVIIVALGLAKVGFFGFGKNIERIPFKGPDPQLANPASENCIKNGGTLEIKTAANGG